MFDYYNQSEEFESIIASIIGKAIEAIEARFNLIELFF